MGKDISNEQLFEFMTKMYSDLTGRIDGVQGEVQGIKGEVQGIKGEMESNMVTKHDIVRLENKMDANHKVLHDGYKQTYEKLTMLEDKVDRIDGKVEKHDVEIRVIRGGK